ncbi:hypothetical protein EJ357_07555 [Streptomyces cyaneochromogenes]|uniref:Uncharacterized protein n=1 Tax=Streptomyces cyaneochromogenes TaxID=2496836 RepID=A0A3Q9EQG7_9ACTN|nr:hypothetical protein EJ357_07555 [Streptomyces cyaneochromogenes]
MGRRDRPLGLGHVPEHPHLDRSVVIVPVSSLSRLPSEALTAASSLGDEVRAVTVCHPDPEDRAALPAPGALLDRVGPRRAPGPAGRRTVLPGPAHRRVRP